MSRGSFQTLRLLACVLSLSLAAGCGDACLSLADKICSCQLDDNLKAACNARAKQQESTFAVGPEDEKLCQQKLDSNACDCTKLITEEGRRACGLVINPSP